MTGYLNLGGGLSLLEVNGEWGVYNHAETEATQNGRAPVAGAEVSGPLNVGSLSVGGGEPVSGVLGDSGDFQYLGAIPMGDITAQSTSLNSTEWVQPYNNSWRQVMPHSSISNVAGSGGIYVSLTGRFQVPSSSSTTDRVYIRVYNVARNTGITETETASSPGASFERFHTPKGQIATADDTQFVAYEAKSDEGTGVQLYGPVLLHYWVKVA